MNHGPTARTAVTILDITHTAAVHLATVSPCIARRQRKVSSAKRAKIERIAREMGYQPNAVASSLRTKKTDIAAIVVPDPSNPLFGPIVKGLEQQLRLPP